MRLVHHWDVATVQRVAVHLITRRPVGAEIAITRQAVAIALTELARKTARGPTCELGVAGIDPYVRVQVFVQLVRHTGGHILCLAAGISGVLLGDVVAVVSAQFLRVRHLQDAAAAEHFRVCLTAARLVIEAGVKAPVQGGAKVKAVVQLRHLRLRIGLPLGFVGALAGVVVEAQVGGFKALEGTQAHGAALFVGHQRATKTGGGGLGLFIGQLQRALGPGVTHVIENAVGVQAEDKPLAFIGAYHPGTGVLHQLHLVAVR